MRVVLEELTKNNRNPFRTIPLVVGAPELLSKQFGFLATSLPLLLSFGFLLGYQCYRRFNSFWFSALAITCAFGFPGLIHPTNGYGANWLDMPAAMAMGVAVLSLLRFNQSHDLNWLALFGTFATITATSRWSAATYLAFYGAPVLLLGVFRYSRHRGNFRKAVAVCAITAGVGVIFVLYHVPSTYWYYSNVCFGMGSTYAESFACTSQGLVTLLQPELLCVLFCLLALNVWNLFRSKPAGYQIQDFVANLWFPVSLLILLTFILKSAQAIHPMVYLVPALFVSAFTADCQSKPVRAPISAVISVVLILFLIRQSFHYYHQVIQWSKHPDPQTTAAKQIDLTLAKYLGVHKILTYSEYDDERSMATMDCFYQSGWKPNFREKSFSIHEPYFKAWYPNKTPLEVAQTIFDDDTKEVGLVLIHENAADISKNTTMNNPYSMTISAFMTKYVPASPAWKKVATWSGPYGNLAAYENVSLFKKSK